MKVLLPIDFSEATENGICAIERRPWAADTEITVLYVVDTMRYLSPGVDRSPYIESQSKAAKDRATEVATRLSSHGLKATGVVRWGYPPAVIINYADKTLGADLIVVSSQGRGAVARFLLGSVAKHVLQFARCSVEIARKLPAKGSAAPMNILLATDGSSFSEWAAKSVAQRPWPKGSVVEVLAVAEATTTAPDAWNAAIRIGEEVQSERLKVANEAVESAEKTFSSTGLSVSSKIVSGNPKSAILDEAKNLGADLIAVGSHGRQGLRRLLLGGVAEAVALHSHCLVEVIRERP
jgi:nucleotide-binding universal stress UspA family protein